jgi:hypothetical protein
MRNPPFKNRPFGGFLLFLFVAGGVTLGLWMYASAPTDHEIKETVLTSLQQETDTTVMVTGYLTVSTRLTIEDARRFPISEDLPWYAVPLFRASGSPQVNLGTNRTSLQVPGRVSYGISLQDITIDDIEILDRRTVRIDLPELQIYSIEPELQQLNIRTELGWARWSSSGRQLERRALGEVRTALERQGHQHLQQSDQPAINTMLALERLLGPALRSAGVENPRFEFRGPSMPLALPTASS